MIIIGRHQVRLFRDLSLSLYSLAQESVDIMEKEGGLLADRPRVVAAGEIMSRGLRMILSPAGEQFRRLRRLRSYLFLAIGFVDVIWFRAAHTHLQAKAAESYAPIQMDAARDVILDILDNPKGHQAAANR